MLLFHRTHQLYCLVVMRYARGGGRGSWAAGRKKVLKKYLRYDPHNLEVENIHHIRYSIL